MTHVFDLKVFYNNHRGVFADDVGSLVKKIVSHIGNLVLNLLNSCPRTLPVIAEFHLPAHLLLSQGKPILMAPEAVQWRDDLLYMAVPKGGKPNDSHIDANGGYAAGLWLRHGPFGLDRNVPMPSFSADGHVFDQALKPSCFFDISANTAWARGFFHPFDRA